MQSHPIRVRGLKRSTEAGHSGVLVAPYTGAWIETRAPERLRKKPRSHPIRVRGLKPRSSKRQHKPERVAPYTGAWIETDRY